MEMSVEWYANRSINLAGCLASALPPDKKRVTQGCFEDACRRSTEKAQENPGSFFFKTKVWKPKGFSGISITEAHRKFFPKGNQCQLTAIN